MRVDKMGGEKEIAKETVDGSADETEMILVA